MYDDTNKEKIDLDNDGGYKVTHKNEKFSILPQH